MTSRPVCHVRQDNICRLVYRRLCINCISSHTCTYLLWYNLFMKTYKRFPQRLTGFKICSRCGVLKHVSKFYRASIHPEGLLYHCKKCENANFKERATLMRYGITRRKYNEMVEAQNNKCLICGVVGGSPENYGKLLAVDHNHITNEIRGLLCWNCNNGIGRFKDNVELLKNAIDYLQPTN